jgi:hypothetical protein
VHFKGSLERDETKDFHSWDELKILFPLEEGDIVLGDD